MDLALVRTEFRPDGIFSELRNAAGEMLFVTLERAYGDGLGAWLPKLADGVYTCQRRLSPKFGYELFQIMGVPPFMGNPVTFLEIHIGNRMKDSIGCVLVGLNVAQISGAQMICQSKVAFSNLMAMQAGVDSFMLTVSSS